MFVHIRKHQKWLLILIIAVVVVSFVIFFTPNVQYGSLGGSGRSGAVGSIAGRPVTLKEFHKAAREVMLRSFLFTRQWPDAPEEQTPNHLLLLEKVQDHGIQVSEKAASRWIVNAFKDPETNKFRRDFHDNLKTNILPQNRMDYEDFLRFVKNQIAINQLMDIVGLSGELVPPSEADRLYRRESLQADTQVVFFSQTNFIDVGMSLEGIETFYTNRMALYRKPEQRRIHYLKFAATNYLAEAEARLIETTNLAAMIDRIYRDKGADAFTENGAVLSEEAAKEQIQQQELEKTGWQIAREKMRELAEELFKIKPLNAEKLPELAAAEGYTAQISEPFAANQPISDLDIPYELTQQAFTNLTEEIPFTQPFFAPDGVYLVALHSILPSTIPPFNKIRGQVIADFYEQRALQKARTAAGAFHNTITNRLAQGATFETICQEAGYQPVPMPLFSIRSQTIAGSDPRANLYSLQNLAFARGAGEASHAFPTRDGAMILFVNAFIDAPQEQIEKELPDYTETLRQSRRSETINEWFREEQKLLNFSIASEQGTPTPASEAPFDEAN